MVSMERDVSERTRVGLTSVIIAISLLLFSVLSSCYIILSANAGKYNLLFMLPLCYGLISFFAILHIGNCFFRSMVSVLIFGGYFVRMVLTPFLFALGEYESFLGSCVTKYGITNAVIYMCFETVVVLGMAAYLGKHVGEKKNEIKMNFLQYNTRVFNFIIISLFLFLIIAYISIPAISDIYIFLPFANFNEISEIRWDNETIVARGSIERYVYSLFCFLWPVFRIIIPSLMISHFYRKYGVRKKGMFCSFLCLILPAILLGGDNIAPFIGIFIGIIVINKLYGKQARKFLTSIGIVAVILLGIVIASKISSMTAWKGATGISVIAQMLHNYFPGFDNMAVMFDMSQNNKLITLFYDLYYAIPFKETLFGLHGEYIQDVFLNYTGTGGQIVPFAGQLYYYFGPLSLVFLVFFVRLAYKMEYKSRQTDNFWLYFIYMYISVSTAMSLSIYSVSIYIRGLVNVVLPAYLIIMLIKKRGRKQLEK